MNLSNCTLLEAVECIKSSIVQGYQYLIYLKKAEINSFPLHPSGIGATSFVGLSPLEQLVKKYIFLGVNYRSIAIINNSLLNRAVCDHHS